MPPKTPRPPTRRERIARMRALFVEDDVISTQRPKPQDAERPEPAASPDGAPQAAAPEPQIGIASQQDADAAVHEDDASLRPDPLFMEGATPPPYLDETGLAALKTLVEDTLFKYIPAREDFYTFCRITKPDLETNWFIEKLCKALQKFYEDVRAGRQPRLMIFAPPRHGKTETVSRRFPAWVFGKWPEAHVMGIGCSSPLTQRTNRDIQRIMDSAIYRNIFPNIRLGESNVATISGKPLRNSDLFEVIDESKKDAAGNVDITALGSYRNAGVGGTIVGMGFNIGLPDDLISNAEEANSETIRNGIWEWWETTFYTRQLPNAGIAFISTRWHMDDPAGRLIKNMLEGTGDKWEIISFPALAEEDEEFRKEGEALCPARYSKERLEDVKKASSAYTWATVWQQRPTPKGGAIFKRDKWKFWKALPAKMIDKVISVDCSFKDLNSSDYVAIQVWALAEDAPANKYLLKRTRERMGFAATVQAIRTHKALHPDCIAVLVEDKANGSAVIETLKTEIPGVLAIQPEGGKIARAFAMQPEQEAGNVWLPDSSVDPTIEIYLGEVSAFPGAPNDDETDSTTQAVNWYRLRESELGMLHWMEKQMRAQQGKSTTGEGAHQ